MKKLAIVKAHPRLGLVILAYVAFIALGMPDGLLGVAWPSIREGFTLPLDALGSLLFASTAGYLTSSFLSGRLISHLGVGKVLALSCAMTGIALLGYTLAPAWGLVVALGILAGLGAGAIDAGLNTYVAAHFGAGMMQWLHASYGIGITSGPFIMTAALSAYQSWRSGYLIVSGVQLALAACFAITLPIWAQDGSSPAAGYSKSLTASNASLLVTLLQPRVWLSLLLFFLYTGAEVTLGTWAYTLLTESRGVAPQAAGFLAGSYWAMFTAGRIVAGLFAKRVGISRLVVVSLFSAFLGAVLLWWNPSPASNLAAVGVIGLSIAPIYPGLVSGTSRRVGLPFTANSIGMQVAAAGLGAAAVPSLVGALADSTSLEIIPVCLTVLFASQAGLLGLAQIKADRQA